MRLINVNTNAIGKLSAIDVRNGRGQIILKGDTELKDCHIKGLSHQGIKSIYILDQISSEVSEVGLIAADKKRNIIKKFAEIADYVNTNKVNMSTRNKIKLANEIDILLDSITDQIKQEIDPNKVLEFIDTARSNHYIFEHIINVAIYVNYLSRLLKYNPKKQNSILKAALTYDIGMLAIDQSLLKKEERLSRKEMEEVEKHTILGYQFLDNFTNLTLLEKLPALQHHKWLDGTGYPDDLKHKDLHEFSQIIALADVFEAMTSDRPYRNALPHAEAINYILESGALKFNTSFVTEFTKHIVLYSKGTKVKLSDRSVGYVVENKKNNPTNPKLLVIRSGDELPVGYVNLEKYDNVDIVRVVLE